MLGNFWKIADSTAKRPDNEQGGDAAFAVSKRPLVPRESQRQEVSRNQSRDYENLGELPRSYGRPVLFGIARDPSTLFVYWEIDWHRAFGAKPPADRKVYLRVFSSNGDEEIRAAVEPLAGNHCVPVTQASGIYRIELGYDEPSGVWNSVAQSDRIATPPDDVSDDASIDVATVPFHLSFQHMIDSFRGSKYDGDALVGMVGRLQERADSSAEADLPEADRELLRAIGCTLSGSEGGRRARLRRVENAFATRQKVEAILGFGVSSR